MKQFIPKLHSPNVRNHVRYYKKTRYTIMAYLVQLKVYLMVLDRLHPVYKYYVGNLKMVMRYEHLTSNRY